MQIDVDMWLYWHWFYPAVSLLSSR